MNVNEIKYRHVSEMLKNRRLKQQNRNIKEIKVMKQCPFCMSIEKKSFIERSNLTNRKKCINNLKSQNKNTNKIIEHKKHSHWIFKERLKQYSKNVFNHNKKQYEFIIV